MFPKTFPKNINFIWLDNLYLSIKLDYNIKYLFIKGNGIVLNPGLFKYSFYKKKIKSNYLHFLIQGFSNVKIIRTNQLIFVYDLWSDGIYHFMVDVMSKIAVFEKSGYIFEDFTLVLPDSSFSHSYVIPFIKKINLNFRSIVFLSISKYYLFIGKNIYFRLPHSIGSNNRELISLIQNKIFNHISHINEKAGTRVYYYRSNRRRLVVNDNEVINYFKKLGFLTINFDLLSFDEIINVMSNSNVLIGIHGGGLTNMMFMPKKSKIIEFKTDNPNPENHCYWHLARSLEHEYYLFIGTSTDKSNNIVEGSKGCDLKIDLQLLDVFMKTYILND